MAFSWADAQAQWFPLPTGPGSIYFGVEGGYTNLEDQTGHIVGAGAGVGVGQRFDDGYNVGARAGYEWGPWRLEEEFRFQQNGISRLTVGPFAGASKGDANAYAFMTNLIYDFTNLNLPWAITPHIGAGIGAVELRDGVSIPGIVVPGVGALGGSFAHDTQWEFGYQAIAGIRYNINPALAFDLDYRYLATTDPTFRTSFGSRFTSGYSTNNLVASLTMRFGAPPPVVAPPAPPPPPLVTRRVFLVFFDWDRDTITPDGMRIIQQAADAFRAGAPVQIQVTGYTDASGSAGYNQRLSERRANNVANALARFGVARQAMVVSGRGKNDQRVPTADGVREPQNRRVEIVFP
jgi:OOP family OmpA-OmpF porin